MPPMTLPTLPTSTQLASPSNHSLPSTRITVAGRGRPRRFLAPVHDVRERPDAVLHARRRRRGSSSASKPGAGHHREVLAVDACRGRAAPARRAGRSGRRPRGPSGCRGWSRAGWRCRPGGSRPSPSMPASASTQRCTMPSPPHTKTRSAPFSSICSTASGAFRLFGTSDHSGSLAPSARQDPSQLTEAAAERLPGVGDHRDRGHDDTSMRSRASGSRSVAASLSLATPDAERTARRAMRMAPIPSTTLARTSVG